MRELYPYAHTAPARAIRLTSHLLSIDGVVVIRKTNGRFQPVDSVIKQYDRTHVQLLKLAGLLHQSRLFEVFYIASFGLHDPFYGREAEFIKAGYDSSEPRDDKGRWTSGISAESQPAYEEAQYRGKFHDEALDDLLKGLAERGSSVVKNIRVLGLNGILAVPDGASKPINAVKPYFIEMKTGNDPEFTANQKSVYPLICMGGHATSYDPRIAQLGLTPGRSFPPMDIMLVYTSGPGMPLSFGSYCVLTGLWSTPDGP